MCLTAYIGLEAHMCFVDFSEGHRQHKSFSWTFFFNKLWFILSNCKNKERNQPLWYCFLQTHARHLSVYSFFLFNKVDRGAFFSNCFFFLLPLLKLLTRRPVQLCSQIMLLPYGKTSGELKFPGSIPIMKSEQGSFHTRLSQLHKVTHIQTNTQKYTELSAKIYFLVEVQCHR